MMKLMMIKMIEKLSGSILNRAIVLVQIIHSNKTIALKLSLIDLIHTIDDYDNYEIKFI